MTKIDCYIKNRILDKVINSQTTLNKKSNKFHDQRKS